jgi:hypothetical protein
MKYRLILVALAGAATTLLVVALSAAAGPPPRPAPPVLTIASSSGNGITPFAPVRLSMSDLQAMTQTTETVTIGGVSTTESGPLLTTLLTGPGGTGGPLHFISACMNDELRYWILANGAGGASAQITYGEIDPSFGGRPTIVSDEENGSPLAKPRLVVAGPNETTDARDIQDVTNITVGRAPVELEGTASNTTACNPPNFTAPITAPATDSVTINGEVARPETLTLDQLGSEFPQVTQTDTLRSRTTKMNTEIGPTLFDVLSAAEPKFTFCPGGGSNDLDFYVEVTSGDDGSAVLVSWPELDPAYDGDQILLSVNENGKPTTPSGTGDIGPRLTVPEDNEAGRYLFSTSVITVFRATGSPGGLAGLLGLAGLGGCAVPTPGHP